MQLMSEFKMNSSRDLQVHLWFSDLFKNSFSIPNLIPSFTCSASSKHSFHQFLGPLVICSHAHTHLEWRATWWSGYSQWRAPRGSVSVYKVSKWMNQWLLSQLETESHIVKAGRDLRKYLIQCPFLQSMKPSRERCNVSSQPRKRTPWLVNGMSGYSGTATEDNFLVYRWQSHFSYYSPTHLPFGSLNPWYKGRNIKIVTEVQSSLV